MSSAHELPKTYDPAAQEQGIYDFWLKGGFFNGEVDRSKKPYCIVIPPPNITGQLHMGHAFDNTLQDILIRLRRMQGYATLWQPGTDHAGIATQARVEEELRGQGQTRHDLGREAFVSKVWQWKEEYGGRIIHQLHRLGASCDWRRTRFTMDEGLSAAVLEVFVDLYRKDLIYKGNRIINWCPRCATAISDIETEHEDQAGHLWHIRYPIEGSDECLTIATTRPETMMGDTGIAVHPQDERYQHLIGKRAILPLMNRPIPIFADDYVDRDFGTGCVKVTPSHDPNDFDMGKRHDLEFILIMDGAGRINENGGKYRGLSREEARKAVLADLEAQGLLAGTEDHRHNVGTCQRCGTVIEPMASSQWFVKMAPLAQEALKAVYDGDIRFVPERFAKTYLNWMENVHDWCISRQLWWGHRIPAYYCDACGHMTVAKEAPPACPQCGGTLRQDEDVLDTWFSSALWPFSTLGWPEKTEELDFFYPTSVLVTGYDIIFFWVARMIFSGLEHMGQKPFHDVFIHGLVRDSQGRKMSKSLGNGIDPLDIVQEYGADALRLTLVTGIGPGNDTRFYTERVEANRNFCNKLWNASRFVMMNLTVDDFTLPDTLDLEDKWILSRLNTLVGEVTDNMERYELGVAADKLYSFVWDELCDWYIELCKIRLQGENEAASHRAQRVLGYVLTGALTLLHPFMPFITEAIWQALPHTGEALMVSQWPVYRPEHRFPAEAQEMGQIMAAIRSVRNLRAEMNVPPSRKAALFVVTAQPDLFAAAGPFMKRLAWASDVTILREKPADAGKMASCVTQTAQIFMPMGDLVDMARELERLTKEKDNALSQIARIEGKLQNAEFTQKAPDKVVQTERDKLAGFKAVLEKVEQSIAALK